MVASLDRERVELEGTTSV
jgi:hypothetical protein